MKTSLAVLVRRKYGRQRSWLFNGLLLLTLVIICAGVFGIQALTFTFEGGAVPVAQLLGSPTSVTYSTWGIFSGIYLTEYGIQPPEIFVSFVLITFCLLVPIIFNVLMLVIWNCPLQAKTQFLTWQVLQVLQSWGGLDIFISAMLVAGIFSSQITSFIEEAVMHSEVGPICTIIKSMKMSCIDYVIAVKAYVSIIFVAALLLHCSGFYLYRQMLKVRSGKLIASMVEGNIA